MGRPACAMAGPAGGTVSKPGPISTTPRRRRRRPTTPSLPRTARRTGATLVVVNFEETPVSGVAEYEFQADVTEVLPAIADAVGEN